MSLITSAQNDKVLILTLNRPEKFNSFNREMSLKLIAELDRAGNDKNVRCVVLTGEGKAFCAGQDLAEAIDPQGPGIDKIVSEHYNPIIMKIRNLPKPVVGLVNGVAAGAGANIALACDIVLAGRSATFIQAFSKIGLVPDSGGTYTLPRLAGMQLASALMITGDKLNAEDALKFGLVYRVFDDSELHAKGLETAHNIAQLPTLAIARTKELLNVSFSNTMPQQLEAERRLQVQSSESHDYREGVQAFLEKRKADFKGE